MGPQDLNSTQAIADMVSMIIAVAALAVSCLTLRSQVKFNQRSMRPIADFNLEITDSLVLTLLNEGMGPMFVDAVRIPTPQGDLLRDLADAYRGGSLSTLRRRSCDHGVVRAQSEFDLLVLIPKNGHEKDVACILLDARLEIDYHDLYGKRYHDSMDLGEMARFYYQTLHIQQDLHGGASADMEEGA